MMTNIEIVFYCDPSGLASRHLFLKELVRRKQEEPLKDSMLYLTPSEQAARTLGVTVADSLETAFSFRTFTLRQLKNLLSRANLSLPRPASRLVRTIVAAEAVRECRKRGKLSSLYRDMPAHGLTRYLVRLFSEIYASGIASNPKGEKASNCISSRLSSDLYQLFKAFSSNLEHRGFIDPEALFALLADDLEQGRVTHQVVRDANLLVVENPAELTEPLKRFLGALAKTVGTTWISLPVSHPPGAEKDIHSIDLHFHRLAEEIVHRYVQPHQVSWQQLEIPERVDRRRYEIALKATSSCAAPTFPETSFKTQETVCSNTRVKQFESCQEETEYIIETAKKVLHSNPDLYPDDLLIVAPPGTDHIEQLRVAAEKHGVPVSLPETKPVIETRPAEALLRLMRMRLSAYRRDDVLSFLRYLPEESLNRIGAFHLEVRMAGITGGGSVNQEAWKREWMEPLRRHRDLLETSLKELGYTGDEHTDHDSVQAERTRLENRMYSIDEGRDLLVKVFSQVNRLKPRMRPSHFARTLLDIAHFESRNSQADITRQRIRSLPLELVFRERLSEQALRALLGKIAESFEDFGDHQVELSALYTALYESCLEHRLPARAQPGSIPAIRLGNHYGTRAEFIFVCGLSSSSFPSRRRFPFLSSMTEPGQEHFEIDAQNLWNEARATMLWALCSAGSGVLLTCAASRETRDLPSLLLENLAAQLPPVTGDNAWPTVTRGKNYLINLGRTLAKEPVPTPGQTAILPAELPQELHQVIAGKVSLKQVRRLSQFSVFDGMVSAADRLLNADYGPTHAFSASQLESLARCPFHFFASRMLRLEPEEEVDDEITPLTRGSIVHEILSRFYTRRLEAAGLLPDPKRGTVFDEGFWQKSLSVKVTYKNLYEAQSQLEKIAGDVLRQRALLQPGPFWQRELDNLLEGLERESVSGRPASGRRPGILQCFLEDECRQPEETIPVFFEQTFHIDIEPPSGENAVAIKGRIDRVDVVEDGSFLIIDYKTGDPPDPNDITKGLLFQIPLYVLGAEDILRKSSGGSSYTPVGAGYVRLKPVKPENNGRMHFLSVYHEENKKIRLHHQVRERRKGMVTRKEFDEFISLGKRFAGQAAAKIRSGEFHITLQESSGSEILPNFCIKHCPFRTICRVDTTRRRLVLENLIDNRGEVPVNPNLEIYISQERGCR